LYSEAEKIRYDGKGDYTEVIFERKAGDFRETENDAVMERKHSKRLFDFF